MYHYSNKKVKLTPVIVKVMIKFVLGDLTFFFLPCIENHNILTKTPVKTGLDEKSSMYYV